MTEATKCTADNWSYGCCTSANPCSFGEGDCNSNDECGGTLICGSNNCLNDFGFGDSGLDCCINAAGISSIVSSVSNNAAAISSNAAGISNNAGAINSNAAGVSNNAGAINSVVSDVSNNAGAINSMISHVNRVRLQSVSSSDQANEGYVEVLGI